MSTNEMCPTCGQPADMFIFYHLLDDEKELAVGFGCSSCNTRSQSIHLSKAQVKSLYEKMLGIEREQRGGE